MVHFCGQECDYPPEHNCNGCKYYEIFSNKAREQAISPDPNRKLSIVGGKPRPWLEVSVATSFTKEDFNRFIRDLLK
jgi:hypothetical protein